MPARFEPLETPVTDRSLNSERPADTWADSGLPSEPVTPWTAEQVRALEARQPPLSPWRVVQVQVLVTVLLALAWWLLGTEPARQVRSTLWGAAAVVLPHALMAWGLRRPAVLPAQALLRFLVWELVKVGLALVILVVAAVGWSQDLSWPALLVALVLGLKVHVWALWMFARPTQPTT